YARRNASLGVSGGCGASVSNSIADRTASGPWSSAVAGLYACERPAHPDKLHTGILQPWRCPGEHVHRPVAGKPASTRHGRAAWLRDADLHATGASVRHAHTGGGVAVDVEGARRQAVG